MPPRRRSSPRSPVWSLAAAWDRAEKARRQHLAALGLEDTLDGDLQQLGGQRTAQARKLMESYSLADARLLAALRHGTDPQVLEVLKSGSRLIAELCHKSLAVVGLRAGEALEMDASERFQQFLSLWFRGPEPAEPVGGEGTNDEPEG